MEGRPCPASEADELGAKSLAGRAVAYGAAGCRELYPRPAQSGRSGEQPRLSKADHECINLTLVRSDGAERADGGIHATGDELEGAGGESVGGGHDRSNVVNVFAMANSDDEHQKLTLVNLAEDAVIANSPPPNAMKIAAERFSKAPRIA